MLTRCASNSRLRCQIGVIDTGVDVSDPRLSGCRIEGASVNDCSGVVTVCNDFEDLVGHGTGVAALIHAFCTDASLFAVRIAQVVNQEVSCEVSESRLAAAIDLCRELGIRLINVSYCIRLFEEKGGPLERACEAAMAANIIVVAAHNNRSNAECFPAAFASVIGVKRAHNVPRGSIVLVSELDKNVATWGGPVATTSHAADMRFLYGNSYAAAHVSAMIGRMMLVDDCLDLGRAFAYLKNASASVLPITEKADHFCPPGV